MMFKGLSDNTSQLLTFNNTIECTTDKSTKTQIVERVKKMQKS